MSAAAKLAGVYFVYIFTIAFLLLRRYKFTYGTDREFFLRREKQAQSHKHRQERRSRPFSSFAPITVCQTLQPPSSICLSTTLRQCPSILHIQQKQKIWEPRKKGNPVIYNNRTTSFRKAPNIGRAYTIHPKERECFFLRMLLFHKRAPTSFDDLLTVNDHHSSTYHEACLRLELLQSGRQQCEKPHSPPCLNLSDTSLRFSSTSATCPIPYNYGINSKLT